MKRSKKITACDVAQTSEREHEAGVSGAAESRSSRQRIYVLRVIRIAAALLIIAMAVGTVFSKYVNGSGSSGAVTAKLFYFTSDMLDGSSHTLSNGTTSLTITLRNSADDLRVSELDIHYTAEVTGGATVTYGDSSQTLECDPAFKTPTEATITIDGLQSGQSYTVTATGTNGYTEVLTGTFFIAEGPVEVYMHTDTSNEHYVTLTVWTEDYQGDVDITYPMSLTPDNTKNATRTVYTDEEDGNYTFTDSVSFSGNTYSSMTYRFIGTMTEGESFVVKYTVDDETKTAEETTLPS